MSLLSTHNLNIGFSEKGKRKVLQAELNVKLDAGNVISILGQNGVGKSTLIKTLSGLHPKLDGDINLDGIYLEKLSPHEVSRKLSLVLTERPFAANISVVELIALGRHPHSNWLGMLSANDKNAIEEVMTLTNINYLADKKLYQLSDGQYQKVMIARALAQDTNLIILDEPTAHLDLNNKIEVMTLLRSIASKGKGILIATHDLQVSLQMSDLVWLMNFNEPLFEGVPEDLVIEGKIEHALFPTSHNVDLTRGTVKEMPISKSNVTVVGESDSAVWTRQALTRSGFNLVDNAAISITCNQDNWEVKKKDNESQPVKSIRELLKVLDSKV